MEDAGVGLFSILEGGIEKNFCCRSQQGGGEFPLRSIRCFMNGMFLVVASPFLTRYQKFVRKNGMSNALTRSMKNAQTRGTIMNARCEAP